MPVKLEALNELLERFEQSHIENIRTEEIYNLDYDMIKHDINLLAFNCFDDVLSTSSEDDLGFTKVIDYLTKLQKPIISHNGFLDMMFLHEKFIKPLPEKIIDFKKSLKSLFPHIYDTKHMINSRLEL